MGRDAKLRSEEFGTPIHIIMERSTAKTFDCFIEFINEAAARDAFEWVNHCLPVHSPRLGSRHVHVEMSSHDELLQTIFPRAKCVTWQNGMPVVRQNTDPYSTGFQGFLTTEEMYCMIRHAEFPRRVRLPFLAFVYWKIIILDLVTNEGDNRPHFLRNVLSVPMNL